MYYYVLVEDAYIVNKDENYPSIVRGVDKQDYRLAIAFSDNKFDMHEYIRTRHSLTHRIKIGDASILKIRSSNESELLYMLNLDNILAYGKDKIVTKVSYDDKYVQYMTIDEWNSLSMDSCLQIFDYIEDSLVSLFSLIMMSKYLNPNMIDVGFLNRYLQYILYKYMKPSVYNHVYRYYCDVIDIPIDLVTWITRIGGPDNVMSKPF